MAIPSNITREHIVKAIQRVSNEGVPPRRDMRKWALRYNGKLYPVKLLISWANVYPNGEELPCHASVFTTVMGQKYLDDLGFKIVDL